MSIATRPITAEELFAMGDIGRCELIDGEVNRMAPAGSGHWDIAMEVGFRVKAHVNANQLGKVSAAETRFIIARNPDRVRAADVAFVRRERVRKEPQRGFFEGPPDLAVEVVAPNDAHAK